MLSTLKPIIGLIISLAVICVTQKSFAQNITLQGVYVDTDQVLKHRQIDHKLAFRKNRSELAFQNTISLKKLIAEVKQQLTTNQKLSERIRYLDGLVKIQELILDRKNQDLLLVGIAEPWDAQNSFRPRGKRSGRPLIQLDDLIIALRSFGPQSKSRVFGCTLIEDPQAGKRLSALNFKNVPAHQQGLVDLALKKAIGPLKAKYFGIPEETRFAFVCIEADYQMKRLSLGLEQLPQLGLKSYLEISNGKNFFNRFWFTANNQPLVVSEDGTRYQFYRQGLSLNTSASAKSSSMKHPQALKFTQQFTKKMDQLELAIPAFADLDNLMDLAVIAALIAEDKLDQQIEVNLEWILNPQNYAVPKVATPRFAETLVNSDKRGRKIITVAGGVQIELPHLLKNRTQSRSLNLSKHTSWKSSNWSMRKK